VAVKMHSFDINIKRIGFACKIQSSHDKANKTLNTTTTTLAYLNKQTKDKAVEKLWTIIQHNCEVLKRQVEWVGNLPKKQRQFRLSSDLFPGYSHKDWMWFYFEPDVINYLENNLTKLGNIARNLDVRLSFHPGQFCVLASENYEIVDNSIIEFEYHTDIARYMGYGKLYQDFKCNVHIGGKKGPSGILNALKRLSPEARNILTIENAEFTWGLEHSLELHKHCALVLDIHHHWIYSKGEYIKPDDQRINIIKDSWRGIRPVIHYSISREDVLIEHSTDELPDYKLLTSMGFTATKLRAHSDYYWNNKVNEWAASHNSWADIMCESKQKNLASEEFSALLN
jgi:UV DNA damage repair endonuclease